MEKEREPSSLFVACIIRYLLRRSSVESIYIPRYPAAYPGNPVLTPPPPGRRDDVKKTKNAHYTIRVAKNRERYPGEYCRGLRFTFCAKIGSHVCFQGIDRGSPGATTVYQGSSLVMTSNGKARIHGRRRLMDGVA